MTAEYYIDQLLEHVYTEVRLGKHEYKTYLDAAVRLARLDEYEMLTGTATDWEHGVAPTSLWIASEDSLPPLQEDVIVYSELLSYSMGHRTDDPDVITDKYGFTSFIGEEVKYWMRIPPLPMAKKKTIKKENKKGL